MINMYTCVDETVFDTESESDEYACYMRICAAEEAKILKRVLRLIAKRITVTEKAMIMS